MAMSTTIDCQNYITAALLALLLILALSLTRKSKTLFFERRNACEPLEAEGYPSPPFASDCLRDQHRSAAPCCH